MFGMYKYVEIYTKVFPIPTLQVYLACLFECHCELVFHVALECAVAACRDTTSRSGTAYRKDIRAEQTKGEAVSLPLFPVLSPGCQPLFLAFAVCVKVFLTLGSVVIVALKALKTKLGGLLAGIIVLAVRL